MNQNYYLGIDLLTVLMRVIVKSIFQSNLFGFIRVNFVPKSSWGLYWFKLTFMDALLSFLLLSE